MKIFNVNVLTTEGDVNFELELDENELNGINKLIKKIEELDDSGEYLPSIEIEEQ